MQRTHLKTVYDCINRIAREREQKGEDCSKWFYSKTEFEKVKSDKRNRIL